MIHRAGSPLLPSLSGGEIAPRKVGKSGTDERNDFCRYSFRLDTHSSHGDGQLEASWPGTAGVYKENAMLLLNRRAVRMAGDDSGKAGGTRVEVELVQVVQHVQPPTAYLDRGGGRDFGGAGESVVVAAYGRYRRNRRQRRENIRRADVAGVQDVLDPSERGECFGTHQTMRVGDDPNQMAVRPSRHERNNRTLRPRFNTVGP